MIQRARLARQGPQALQHCRNATAKRRMATAASGGFTYETGEAAGVKFASRDLPGPTTHLAVVAKAGTRFQPLPGFSEGLEKFAFKNTNKRSALRITRESELLGGELSTSHTRENLVLSAKFLREDLPYFAELLGEVISETKYTAHELEEEVTPRITMNTEHLLHSSAEYALNSVHNVAFHRGLGNPLYPSSLVPMHKYLQEDLLAQYSQMAYAKSNFAVVANGAAHSDLNKWVGSFFKDSPATPPEGLPVRGQEKTRYFGGEERISHDGGNTVVLAFPGSSSFTGGAYKPELAVLASLLGGQSNIKWAPGFSLLSKATAQFPQAHIETTHLTYSDAGLLFVTMSGKATQVRGASEAVVKALKDTAGGKVSADEIKKAKAAAKFKALESGQGIDTGIELTGAGLIAGGKAYQIDEIGKTMDQVTDEQVKTAAKALLDGKASVSTVGDLYVLPFADEIGLNA